MVPTSAITVRNSPSGMPGVKSPARMSPTFGWTTMAVRMKTTLITPTSTTSTFSMSL